MQKILAKELGKGNIRLSTRLWGILTTHKFDMGNIGYIVGGKQSPGYAAGSTAYLKSEKYLHAHVGRDSVVWVSRDIADFMDDKLPKHVEVG